MKHRELRQIVASIVLSSLAALSVDRVAWADDFYWIDPTGGNFNSLDNWSATDGGAGGAGVPGANDNANFTLDSTYSVRINNSAISSLDVRDGDVTFDLFNTARLTSGFHGIGTAADRTGRLTVKGGTLAVQSSLQTVRLGTVSDSTGFLTITSGGRIGDGTIRPDVTVGDFGTGTLTVNDNGRIDGRNFSVGDNSGSMGTAIITGPNALANFMFATYVGGDGDGTLNITNGGTLTTGADVVMGEDLGADGTVTVSGVGSSWTISGYTTIGDSGDGILTISSGGVVSAGADPVTLGNSATGIGTATVTGAGSAWNNGYSLTVGGAGDGRLSVRSGGAVSADALIIGEQSGSQGRVEIEGAGSQVSSQDIYVGNGGTGILEITSGGRLDTCTTDLCTFFGSGYAYVINGGAARVSGAGSTWVVGADLVVGGTGTGTLTVENGARVEIGSLLLISHPVNGLGAVNFRGGSITALDVIRHGVLHWTDGTLTIDGGSFDNNGGNLTINGADADDLPTLHLAKGGFLSGMGTLLTIGSSRQGAVIMSGAAFPIQQLRTDVGAIDGGSGVLTVTNGAQFTATGDLNLGGTEFMAGGSGTLNVDHASTVVVNDELRLWPGGTVNLNGGTLKFDLDRLHRSGGNINFNAGRIVFPDFEELFDARLDTILGPTHELGIGRTIHFELGPVELDASLNVSGGTFSGDSFNLYFGRTLSLTSGQVTMSNNINISGRIFIHSGRLAAPDIASDGEIQLAGPLATIAAAGLENFGLLGGSGRVDAMLHNRSAGQVRVGSGERLSFVNGPHTNDGLIDLNGGTIEFDGLLRNNLANPSTGLIAARNGTLRFHGGATNAGSIVMSAGVMDVFGDINNVAASPTTGRIIVSGGGTANFYDDITNSGSINVSAAGALKSTAVFFGSLSGNGVGGGGNVFIEGDARPGFSPGVMSFGGDVSFGPFASVAIELAGTTPGTQHDQIAIAGAVTFGGTLDIELIDDFTPATNNQFVLATYNSRAGVFDSVNLPDLPPTLTWSLRYGATELLLSTMLSLLPGDIDEDGDVDRTDAAMFAQYFGLETGSTWQTGDFDGDFATTLADLALLQAHLDQSVPSPSAATVPEPSTVLMLLSAVAVAIVARPFRRCVTHLSAP